MAIDKQTRVAKPCTLYVCTWLLLRLTVKVTVRALIINPRRYVEKPQIGLHCDNALTTQSKRKQNLI